MKISNLWLIGIIPLSLANLSILHLCNSWSCFDCCSVSVHWICWLIYPFFIWLIGHSLFYFDVKKFDKSKEEI